MVEDDGVQEGGDGVEDADVEPVGEEEEDKFKPFLIFSDRACFVSVFSMFASLACLVLGDMLDDAHYTIL